MKNFADIIKKHRQRNDLTQEALADSLGCSVSAVAQYEWADKVPSLRFYWRLCDLLGPSFHADCMRYLA